MMGMLHSNTSLQPLFYMIDCISQQSTAQQKLLNRLVVVLSSRDPLLQFMPESVAVLVLGMYNNTCPNNAEHLARYCPLISYIFAHYTALVDVPKPVWNLLLDVCVKVQRLAEQLRAMSGPTEPAYAPTPQLYDAYKHRYRSTGTCYGASVKRIRPKYTSLVLDERTSVGKKRTYDSDHLSPCSKRFGKVGKLSGGIMAFWCRHRICVGFHIIQKGEGRNDAFSPIYTRWAKAPKLVVYDYACQLMPYDMVRNTTNKCTLGALF